MDLSGVKGKYEAVKTVKKINKFNQATRKKAKSIGSSSDYQDELKDDVESMRST